MLVEKKPDSDLRVVDFGLSKSLHDGGGNGMDVVHTVCGTWAYCAPEVCKSKGRSSTGEYGPKVDIWSFGCIMFVLLSGYHPFDTEGNSSEDQMIVRASRGQWNFVDEYGDVWAGIRLVLWS